MNKQNLEKLEREVEKRLKAKEKQGRKRMRVSGGSVKKIARLIIAK